MKRARPEVHVQRQFRFFALPNKIARLRGRSRQSCQRTDTARTGISVAFNFEASMSGQVRRDLPRGLMNYDLRNAIRHVAKWLS
jgi:hypothetical protein